MLELLSITIDSGYARRLWAHEGNTVFVDLEIEGKRERQAARDTVVSAHSMDDAGRLARLPDRGPLLVRTNPAGAGGIEEARELEALGVDRVMLPMFRSRAEVEAVVEALDAGGGSPPRLSLLAETVDAVERLEEIVDGQPGWVDHVHIGLNDLSLERGTAFLFEPVASGEIGELARRVRGLGRRFGFGGVGMPGEGLVSAEQILGEHVRVGSECVILARSFHRRLPGGDASALSDGLGRVRRWEAHWREASRDALEENHTALRLAIESVLASMGGVGEEKPAGRRSS